jgi:methionyl-tRNA formyltransferase
MKILCCVNADVVSNVALNLLLPALDGHDVGIGLSSRVGAAPDAGEPQARRELRAAEQLLPTEVIFPLIERAGLPDDGRYLTFSEMERHRGIRVTALPNPNRDVGLASLAALAPDLILSIRYGAIFKSAAIAVPKLGILNLHAGLLPAYRGVLASFRALMAGEREIGCTLHYITDGTIDTGPIMGQAPVPADPGRSLFANVLSLYPSGVTLMAQAVESLEAGRTVETRIQGGGTYYSYPSAEEWDEFRRRGWRVADAFDFHELYAKYLRPE